MPTLGDAELLSQLYSHHGDVAYRVALRILGEPADAQDAVQDAFLRTVRVARGDGAPPRERDRLMPWLLRVVSNSALGLLRRRPAASAMRVQALSEGIPAPARLEPAQIVEGRETRREIFDALLALPDQQLAVLTLREYQGLSYAEIALALDLTPSAVKALLFRARESFKAVFVVPRASSERAACGERGRLLAALMEDGATAAWRGYRLHRSRCRACTRAGVGRRRRLRQVRALLALISAPGAWWSTSTAAQAAALSAVPSLAAGGLSGTLAAGPGAAAIGVVIAAGLTAAVTSAPSVAEHLPPSARAALQAAMPSLSPSSMVLIRGPSGQPPPDLLTPASPGNPAVTIEVVVEVPQSAPVAPISAPPLSALDESSLHPPASANVSTPSIGRGTAQKLSRHQEAFAGESQAEYNPVELRSNQVYRSAIAPVNPHVTSPKMVEQAVPALAEAPRNRQEVLVAQDPGAPAGAGAPGQANKAEPLGQVDKSERPGQASVNDPEGRADKQQSPNQPSKNGPTGQANHGQQSSQAAKGEPPVEATKTEPPVQKNKNGTPGQASQPSNHADRQEPPRQAHQSESPNQPNKSQPPSQKDTNQASGQAVEGQPRGQARQPPGGDSKTRPSGSAVQSPNQANESRLSSEADKSQPSDQSKDRKPPSRTGQTAPKPALSSSAQRNSTTTLQSKQSSPFRGGPNTPSSSPSNGKSASTVRGS
jgi:RNA polymerase sigma-70 factor (ECF subfamily)